MTYVVLLSFSVNYQIGTLRYYTKTPKLSKLLISLGVDCVSIIESYVDCLKF